MDIGRLAPVACPAVPSPERFTRAEQALLGVSVLMLAVIGSMVVLRHVGWLGGETTVDTLSSAIGYIGLGAGTWARAIARRRGMICNSVWVGFAVALAIWGTGTVVLAVV
ncbi:hypothetical protein HT102_10060 [Hoyosella sp. G463]|uniref:Uncharacterized protein n=1 Tax=Lolliginicoccus lacisalsi TaxID=2742202 RepID=A0A927JED4_9ACTN|nr:hypothetical protein [Lolliginicoccus lacisalsi]MBD8506832.1 hypothetical protein [Lolliginicoccus lacisalsi]